MKKELVRMTVPIELALEEAARSFPGRAVHVRRTVRGIVYLMVAPVVS